MTATTPPGPRGGFLLAIDTATADAVVALGAMDGAEVAADRWIAGHRHGEELLARISALLAARGVALADLGGIVVGLGPGAFTGLRVGLATGKTLAHELRLPIVGVGTGAALLEAAAAAGATGPLALLMPAGPSDRVLVTSAQPGHPVLVRGGEEPELPAGATILALDLEGRAAETALALGERARDGLARELLRAGAGRIAAGTTDDPAGLVPEYVTLPRGVRAESGAVEWSRDHR